jgi:hypothetical protein
MQRGLQLLHEVLPNGRGEELVTVADDDSRNAMKTVDLSKEELGQV